MSDGYSTDGERIPDQAGDARVAALASELIDASGNLGLSVEKLDRAETLLGLAIVRERVDRDGLTAAEAAFRLVRETIDAWPDDRGRTILRSAFGFDRGTVRGRQKRLSELVDEFNASIPEEKKRDRLDTNYFDHLFVTKISRDVATALLADEPGAAPPADEPVVTRTRQRLALALAVAGIVVVLIAVVFLLLRNDGQGDETSELVFRPVPRQCSIDVCASEQGAIEAQTGGFTPGDFVDVAIFAPSGENANDLDRAYGYNNELPVDAAGSFTWRYWWDPGMEIGTYRVRITDQATGESVEADFEFVDGS